MSHDKPDPNAKRETHQSLAFSTRKPWHRAGLAATYLLAVVLAVAWVSTPVGSFAVRGFSDSQPFEVVDALGTNEALWPGLLVRYAKVD